MTGPGEQPAGAGMALRRVAFVAMPFGTKATGVAADADARTPRQVDFDALWERAFAPALTRLGYVAIRADNQIGAVIVKDMLEQLVQADLVLADVSIPNGNVYYELGVRHAARARGCILLAAEWARPLFDLAQLTQLRYPLPRGELDDETCRAIVDHLVAGVPPLADADGPVFTLTRIGSDAGLSSRTLREVAGAVFDFQTRIAEARLRAARRDKAPLRALLQTEVVQRLPAYALRDLAHPVRDYLTAAEMLALVERLPEALRRDPFFLELAADAHGRAGHFTEAIALLENLVATYGNTPARMARLGARYLEFAAQQRNRQARRHAVASGLDAWRRGVWLDLNDFDCAVRLLAALTGHGDDADTVERERCAAIVRAATTRARELDDGGTELDAALALLAVHERDAPAALRAVDALLDRGAPNWRLVALSLELDRACAGLTAAERERFAGVRRALGEALPVPQERLTRDLLPRLQREGTRYRKCQEVRARPAVAGEIVVSITSDGEETTNAAAAGDMLVENLTAAREQYLVGGEKFRQRYEPIEDLGDGWQRFRPLGRVLGLEITADLMDSLAVGEEFYIMAPWGSEQLARAGDLLVTPLPAADEVYRVARREFDETYAPDTDEQAIGGQQR